MINTAATAIGFPYKPLQTKPELLQSKRREQLNTSDYFSNNASSPSLTIYTSKNENQIRDQVTTAERKVKNDETKTETRQLKVLETKAALETNVLEMFG